MPNEPSSTDPLRVALIGAGRIGAMHAALLAGIPSVRVTCVYDADDGAAAQVAQMTLAGTARVAASDLEAIQADDVDAVVIASPTPLHAGHVEAAAAARKAIFCEKPVAIDIATTVRAMEQVRRSGVAFQIGFNRRYDPTFARLAAAVHEGRIGTPQLYRAFTADPALPRRAFHAASGGIVLDLAIHDLDMARAVMGEVQRVHAVGRNLTEPWIGENGDVDVALITLEFASGALGAIQVAWRAAHGHDLRIEAFGSLGKATAEEPHRTGVRLFDGDGVHADHAHTFMDRFRESYPAELRAFVESVRSGRTPTPGPDDAIRSLALALAVREALASGGPVELEWAVGVEG